MIYRNRARRAATAIIFSWVALRLTLLWPGHDPPHGAALTVPSGESSVTVRDRVAQQSPPRNLSAGLPVDRDREEAKGFQLARWSAFRAEAAPVTMNAMARASFPPDAKPLFGTAANGDIGDISANDTSASRPGPAAPASEVSQSLPAFPIPIAPPAQRQASRLSLSAWSIVRPGGKARTLATSSALGASQAGVRARLDLIEPGAGVVVAANLRLSAPLQGATGREAGAGISLRPVRAIPVELIAETRIALDAAGRDRLAVLVAGGVSDRSLPRGLRLSAYGQAGFVGLRHPDSFVDGAAIVERPLRMARAAGVPAISLGIALAGAAQPRAARLDVGPELAMRQPLGQGGLRLSGGYRWRVAGRARPGSGPALTIGVNF